MLWLVCMDVGYTVVMSVGWVCSVKVRSEKNGVGFFSERTITEQTQPTLITSLPCHCGRADLTS